VQALDHRVRRLREEHDLRLEVVAEWPALHPARRDVARAG